MTSHAGTTSFRSSAVRPGPIGLLAEARRELLSRRRLIRYLVQADLKKKGTNTLLGNLWWVIDPLLQMLIYVVLVAFIFQRGTADYPLFIFAAILPWKWFTSSVNDAITSVTSQDRLIKQLQFPKIVLPTAATFAGILNFAFGLIPLVALMILFYADRLSPYLVLIPVIAVVQLVFTLAVTFVLAPVNVFFRDLGNVARHLLRLWFYLSPALYSLSDLHRVVGRDLAQLALLNPFTILFEAYRAVIYGTESGPPTMPDWTMLLGLLAVSAVLLALTTVFFKRLEPSFAKVL